MNKEIRFKRIRRLKKWMRPLPRRSNIHRYPVLKWFSKFAYERSYLWSFRSKTIVPALFWSLGSYAPHCWSSDIMVFFLALSGKSKSALDYCPAVDFKSFSMGPIYFADYQIGMIFLRLLGIDYREISFKCRL